MSRRSSTASKARASKPKASSGRILHLETFSGIAGNMFLGAMLDLGLSRKQLDEDLAGLGVDYKLRVSGVQRGALSARYVDVLVPGHSHPKRSSRAGKHSAQRAEGERSPTGKHSAQRAEGERSPTGKHDHQHGRSYLQIRRLLEGAKLVPPVRDRALAIFEALGRAEARVHGVELDDVHFHEVGAVDAIVDVTGAAIALHRLGVERVTCTPVALGHGSVETAHGTLPLPAPATLELLKGIPIVPAHVEWETVTPTGAAILRTIVDEFRQLPAMRIESVGHGAGNDRPGRLPNLLRAVLGSSGGPAWDRIVSLETNLDDLVPEHFDYLMERLFAEGALDVSLQNLQMKKNRPGFLVRVLGRPADRLRLAQLLFAESTAIGVRTADWDRLVLEREQRRVETRFGKIGVKLVHDGNGRWAVSAEYEDCKRAARRSGASLREVVRAAEEIARADVNAERAP